MKRTIKRTAGALALFFALGLSAGADSHKHTYSKEWTGDQTGHWHAATCEHAEEKNGFKEHKYDKYVSNKDGTCQTCGTKSRKCKDCGYVETVVEENSRIATKHLFSQEWTSDQTGHWHVATCEHKDQISGKVNHNYGTYSSNNDATCAADGTKTRTCKDCSFAETVVDEGSKFPHTYAEAWTCDETSHWHVATCEHKDQISGKVSHNYGAYSSNNDVTCAADGTKTRTCKDCGFAETVVDEGSKADNHPISDQWSTDSQYHWHAASCEHKNYFYSRKLHESDEGTVIKEATTKADGKKVYKCKVCGYVIKTEVLPMVFVFHDTVQKVDTVTINNKEYDIVIFGDWPQSRKKENVAVDLQKSLQKGAYTYYLGSDGYYYVNVKNDYYRVEPIKWRVITKDYNDTGNALLLAQNILVSDVECYQYDRWNNKKWSYDVARAYLNGTQYFSHQDEFGNDVMNYQYQNKGFLQTAFTDSAQLKIFQTLFESSQDKVFLLDDKEVSNVSYGFPLRNRNGISRIRTPVDFAEQGYSWALRTYYYVDSSGNIESRNDGRLALVPAITISY